MDEVEVEAVWGTGSISESTLPTSLQGGLMATKKAGVTKKKAPAKKKAAAGKKKK
ncbi:MAG: hypothetical protein U0587_13920 [Candidatus Binatia bacterium]